MPAIAPEAHPKHTHVAAAHRAAVVCALLAVFWTLYGLRRRPEPAPEPVRLDSPPPPAPETQRQLQAKMDVAVRALVEQTAAIAKAAAAAAPRAPIEDRIMIKRETPVALDASTVVSGANLDPKDDLLTPDDSSAYVPFNFHFSGFHAEGVANIEDDLVIATVDVESAQHKLTLPAEGPKKLRTVALRVKDARAAHGVALVWVTIEGTPFKMVPKVHRLVFSRRPGEPRWYLELYQVGLVRGGSPTDVDAAQAKREGLDLPRRPL